MLFCLATGLKSGPRAGFRAALGAASGEVVHISASAVGLAALFRAAPPLFDAVRILGARGVRKARSRFPILRICRRDRVNEPHASGTSPDYGG